MARPRSVAAQRIRRRLFVLGGIGGAFLGLIAITLLLPGQEQQRLTVYAAASLTDAMRDVEAEFEAEYPNTDLVVSTAATSVLARQIEQGAPADVFLAASPEWTDYLAEQNLLRYPARAFVGNQLVVIGNRDTGVMIGSDELLQFDRIALADRGVPAGEYARDALRQAGVWDEVEPRIVPTSDVRAAVAAVRTGAASVAVVYRSDAVATPDVRVVYAWPPELHPTIRYTVAIPRDAPSPNLSLEFVEFIRASKRIDLWRRHGFAPLAEPVLP